MKKTIFLLATLTLLNAEINIVNDSVTNSSQNTISTNNQSINISSNSIKQNNSSFEKGALLLENKNFKKAKAQFQNAANAGDEKSKKILDLASNMNQNLSNEDFSKQLMKKVCNDDSLLSEFQSQCSGSSIFDLFTNLKVNKAALNLRTFVSDLTSYYLVNDDFSSDINDMTNVALNEDGDEYYYQVGDENCLKIVFGTNIGGNFNSSNIENATSFKFIVNNIDGKYCSKFFQNQGVKSMMGNRRIQMNASRVYQVGGSKVHYY